MDQDSNQPNGATAAVPDLRFRRVERPGRPTDPPRNLTPPDVAQWQRAIERARTPGESVPLERVLERLGDDDEE